MAGKERVSIVIDAQNIRAKKKIKEVDTSIAALGKRVKTFSRNWGVSNQQAMAYQKRLVKEVKQGGIAVVSQNKKIDTSLESLGNRFRYLSMVVGVAAVAMVMQMRKFLDVSKEAVEVIMSLSVVAARQGVEFGRAQEIVQKLTDTGLIPYNKAAEVVRNLMLTGLGMDEVETASMRLTARALVMREAQYGVADAVVACTRGLAYYREQMADALLVQGIFNLAIEKLRKTTGKTRAELDHMTIQQEAVRIYSERSADMIGLLVDAQDTLTGVTGRSAASIYDLSRALGDSLLPYIAPLIDGLTTLTKELEKLARSSSPVAGATLMIVTALTSLFAVLAAVGAILPMLTRGMMGITAMFGLASMSLGKFMLLAMGVTAGIALLAYGILKATGRWDRYAGAVDRIISKYQGLKTSLKDIGQIEEDLMGTSTEAEGIDENRAVAHRRKVEDIMEDLEREKSKGLWANQMSIKDLEKRLRRENEDWSRYRSGLKKGEEEETKIQKTQLEIRLDNMLEMVKERASAIQEEYAKIGKISLAEFWKNLHDPTIWREGFLEVARIIRSWHGAFYYWAKQLSNNFIEGLSIIFSLDFWREYFRTIIDAWIGLGRDLKEIGKAIAQGFLEAFSNELRRFSPPSPSSLLKGLISPWTGLWPFQFGGIVPGRPGQPVPIMAHGGERIVPSRETGGGGSNITINFNGAVVREESDLDRIAQKVGQILGQKNKWQRMGAF